METLTDEMIFAYHFDKGDIMDKCANTAALNRYLSGEEQAEMAAEDFEQYVSEHLEIIGEAVQFIKKAAHCYDFNDVSYDFEDLADDLIKEVI